MALQKSCIDHYAYFCFGNLKYEEGDLYAAMENYTKAIQVNFTEDLYSFYLEAVKKDKSKDYHGAIKYFSEVVEIDQSDEILFFLGQYKIS